MPMINNQKNLLVNSNANKGFSLIETLLAIFILAGLILIISLIARTSAERLLHTAMAQYVDQVRLSVQSLLSVPANYSILYTAADATADGFIQTNITALRNGTILPGNVIAPVDNFENSFVDNTLFENGLEVIIRIADDRADITDKQKLEFFVASNDRLQILRARGIASELKGYGGILDNLNLIESVYASWQVPFNNLTNTAWHATVTSGTVPSSQNGVYLVTYDHVSFEDITGDYLYRNAIPGQPNLNKMYTQLDLGRNNILGVDDLGGIFIAGQGDYRSGDMTFNSKVILNNASLTVGDPANGILGQAIAEEGNIYVDGITTIGNNLNIQGLGNDPGSTGRFITQGNLEIRDQLITNRMDITNGEFNQPVNFNGVVNSTSFNVNSAAVIESINSAQANITGNVNAMNIANSISTNQLNANDVNVQGSGRVGAVGTSIAGTVSVNRLISTGDLDINSLRVQDFGACDNGC